MGKNLLWISALLILGGILGGCSGDESSAAAGGGDPNAGTGLAAPKMTTGQEGMRKPPDREALRQQMMQRKASGLPPSPGG